MSVLGMLLSLLLLISSLQQPTSSHSVLHDIATHDEKDKVLLADVILSSLNATATCLEKENLFSDVMTTLRILQAYVKGVMELWAMNPAMEPISKKMKMFSIKLEELVNKSISYSSVALSGNLGIFEVLTRADFWKILQPSPLIKDTVIPIELTPLEPMKEDSSESCLATLLNNRGNSESCTYSDVCRQLMTTPANLHDLKIQQLLFFLSSKMIGCTNGMFEHTQDYLNRVCSNLMDMNAQIESFKYHSSFRSDFLESIMFCGAAGFHEFYKPHWLVNILHWQNATDGCFSTSCK
ncbi:PREDICTED: UPF0764 protein C16orf89-like [Elephantulus edwardii]|uniref:UPF0764 protein C16orf89-like n=1 Tax=Elephantulus edwardii TaxID=28737 RepID=UPI0003F07E19|nr:PREDICTED: UPF0764 protein C16orf89-like [Elephantulus edwardii]